MNWPNLFLKPFSLFITNISHGKESRSLITVGYEIVSFYAVKAVSCQRPPKAKHGLPGWEPRHCRRHGECSKGKDQVPCARWLFKKKINKSGWKRNGNLGIHSSGPWARWWMSRRVRGCAHPSLAGHFTSKLDLGGKPEFPRSDFAWFFRCVFIRWKQICWRRILS